MKKRWIYYRATRRDTAHLLCLKVFSMSQNPNNGSRGSLFRLNRSQRRRVDVHRVKGKDGLRDLCLPVAGWRDLKCAAGAADFLFSISLNKRKPAIANAIAAAVIEKILVRFANFDGCLVLVRDALVSLKLERVSKAKATSRAD